MERPENRRGAMNDRPRQAIVSKQQQSLLLLLSVLLLKLLATTVLGDYSQWMVVEQKQTNERMAA